MKKNKFFSLLCAIMSLVIVMSVVALSSSAEDEILKKSIKKIAAIDAADNDAATSYEWYDHGYTPNITAVQNPDGTYCLCVVMRDGSLSIIELNADYSVKNTVSVPAQLSCFVSFCKGTDGTYYVLFNQTLTVDIRNSTALRLVNIDTDGEVIRSLELSGMASGSWLGVASINCGNNAMTANGKYLTAYIARDMFPVKQNPITGKDEFTESGTVHQSSYAFAVDLENFTLVEVETATAIPYASHSFHQMILKDGNNFVYVDRGDAEPERAYHITKMSGDLQWKEQSEADSFIFKGDYADNNTYGQLGGIIRSGDKYMLVGSYENTTSSTDPSAANIFVQMFDAATLTPSDEFYLTSYTGIEDEDTGVDTVTNPKVIRANENYVLIPYMLSNHILHTEEMHVILADNNGEVIWDKTAEANSGDPVLPRYGQVYFDTDTQSVVWFSIVKGELVVNSVKINLSADEPDSDESTTDEVTTVPSSPTEPESTAPTQSTTVESSDVNPTVPEITTARPETTTQQPEPEEPELSLWDKIVNFFIGIYNFFVSLFN